MRAASYALTTVSALLGAWALAALVPHMQQVSAAMDAHNDVGRGVASAFVLWDLTWLAVWLAVFCLSFKLRRPAHTGNTE